MNLIVTISDVRKDLDSWQAVIEADNSHRLGQIYE